MEAIVPVLVAKLSLRRGELAGGGHELTARGGHEVSAGAVRGRESLAPTGILMVTTAAAKDSRPPGARERVGQATPSNPSDHGRGEYFPTRVFAQFDSPSHSPHTAGHE